ncbi:MAG: hypothetical protein MI684_02070 [Chlorobiales bacterium]|nr:hypothetical protein [Chlorobiales bacterium]
MIRAFFLLIFFVPVLAVPAQFAAAKNAPEGSMTEIGVDGVINAPMLERRAGQRPPSSSSCQGVDLVIEQVELKRTSSGMYLQATVKNICTGSCNADGIDIEIDESLIPGGTGGVVQPIGVARIEPGGTYRNSWVGVMSNPSGSSTYIVKAVLKGGSRRERSSANNSCRVTIAVDEDSKTKSCR